MTHQATHNRTCSRIAIGDIVRSVAPWPIKARKLIDHLLGGALCALLPDLPKGGAPPAVVRRLLMIRPGGMGDAVFLLPIIRAIYQHNPGMEITILCERRNAGVFRSQTDLPLIVLNYEKRDHREVLSRQNFDAVMDTEQWHYISALMARFASATFKVGFATRVKRAKCFSCVVPYALDGYELDNFAALFRPLRLFPEEPLTLAGAFRVPQEARQAVDKYGLENHVALFLGGSIKLRQLTPEQAAAIAKLILDKGKQVVLLGGKDAAATANKVMAHLPNECVTNLTGVLSLSESAAVIEKCIMFIGTDSGLLHIAAALNIPLIAIFGPGNWEKWGPRHTTAQIVKTQPRWCTYFGYTLPEEPATPGDPVERVRAALAGGGT